MVAIGRAQASSREAGHEWTTDERDAAAGLLISRNRIHAVQGLAGSAKTSTVLASFAGAAFRQGREVTAMAPTGSATETLGAALGVNGITVDQHLINIGRPGRPADRPAGNLAGKVWIVDEASLLSPEKMLKLGKAALRRDARLINEGNLGPREVRAISYEAKGLTGAEKKMPFSHERNDIVRFRRGYDFDGVRVEKGEYLRVTKADQDAGRIHMVSRRGEAIEWRPAEKGAGMADAHRRRHRTGGSPGNRT